MLDVSVAHMRHPRLAEATLVSLKLLENIFDVRAPVQLAVELVRAKLRFR